MSPEFERIMANITVEIEEHLNRLDRLCLQQLVLHREIDDCKRQMDFVKEFMSSVNSSLTQDDVVNKYDSMGNSVTPSGSRCTRNTSELRVGNIAFEMMKKRQAPISVAELWAELNRNGKKVKREGIPSILTRDDRFVRVNRGVYMLKA